MKRLLTAATALATQVQAETVLRVDEVAVGEMEPSKAIDVADSVLLYNLYDTLVYPDVSGQGRGVVPHLAETIDVVDDNVYRIAVRDGVRFHSGNTLDAHEVVYSLNRMSALGRGFSYLFGRLGEVRRGGGRPDGRGDPDRALRAAFFSAWGMLQTDLRRDYVQTGARRVDLVDPADLEAAFEDLERTAREDFAREEVDPARLVFQRAADMRYKGQEHTVHVSLPAGGVDAAAMTEWIERFRDLHETLYHIRLDVPAEVVNCHLAAFAAISRPALTGRDELGGDPAVAEERGTVVVIPPGRTATVDGYDNIVIPIGG